MSTNVPNNMTTIGEKTGVGVVHVAQTTHIEADDRDDHRNQAVPDGDGFLSPNALTVLRKRYLRRSEDGKPIETAADMFRRVAENIASADRLHGARDEEVKRTEGVFYDLMTQLEFLPNSPTLRGAGRRLQQLSGCFVVPVGDSLEEIFDALKVAATIHHSGGGWDIRFPAFARVVT